MTRITTTHVNKNDNQNKRITKVCVCVIVILLSNIKKNFTASLFQSSSKENERVKRGRFEMPSKRAYSHDLHSFDIYD